MVHPFSDFTSSARWARKWTVRQGLSAAVPLLVLALMAAFSVPVSAQYFSAPIRDGDRIFRKDVCNWYDLRKSNIVMQQRDYSCGAAALATLIRYYWGDPVTEELFLAELETMLSSAELYDRMENGLALTDLRSVAVRTGYLATMGRISFSELTESKIPLVVGIVVDDYKHFVVFRGFDGEWVYLADPTRGNIRVPSWKFMCQWQRNAVLVVVKKGAEPRDWSPLGVTCCDAQLGATNWQLIRTLPPRVIHKP